MVDLLRTGLSGLLASQRALAVASHNIANANTAGYSRQRAALTNNLPAFMGRHGTNSHYIGTGVNVQSVNRVYDDFLTRQTRGYNANVGQLETMDQWISQLDGVVGKKDTGLAPAINQFFAAVQDAANSPASLPARQALLGKAETLAARFQEMNGQMNALREGANQTLTQTVGEINTLTENIAKINESIVRAQGSSGGAPPDLLDQRDQLVADLARKAPISTLAQADGTLSVFIGNGQPLVQGHEAIALETAPSASSQGALDVRVKQTGVVLTDSLHGGEIGGLLDFQSQVLAPAQNQLDALAKGVAATFNAQHKLGKDLDGKTGENFFSAATGAADFKVAITDPRKFAAATDDGTGNPAPGDNSNALKLVGLQTQKTIGGSSYQEAHSQMVAEVGARGSAASSSLTVQTALLEQATQARDSVSGVNLDEEAANLMKYQQAYEAAAKVVQVGDSIMQTVLDMVRR